MQLLPSGKRGKYSCNRDFHCDLGIYIIYPSRFGMQLEDEPTVVKTWAEFVGPSGNEHSGSLGDTVLHPLLALGNLCYL